MLTAMFHVKQSESWLDRFALFFELAPFFDLVCEVREPRIIDAVIPDDVVVVCFGFFS